MSPGPSGTGRGSNVRRSRGRSIVAADHGDPDDGEHTAGERCQGDREGAQSVYTADAALLLHDIGHEVATLSALVAAVRVEGELDAAAGERLELVEREIDLLLDLVGSRAATGDDADGLVDLRALLQDVVEARADVALPPRCGGGAVAEVVLRDRDTRRAPVSGREARA